MHHPGIQSYRRTQVMTADPKRLVIMCYEAVIENLKAGKQKLMDRDYEAKGKALTRGRDILNELICGLDFDKGGAVAAHLDALYNYMVRRIFHADVDKDIPAIDEVIGLLQELLSAWKEIAYPEGNTLQADVAKFRGAGPFQTNHIRL